MNQGLYGFPNPNDPLLVDIKEFDASGTYRIPDGTKLITFHVIGGGAGGRSGQRNGSGGLGGGGGGGGGTVVHTFLREQIRGSLLAITIGAGGIGGATTNGNYNSGTVGGATSVTVSGAPGVLLLAGGGGIHTTIAANRNPNGVNIFNGVPIQLASTTSTTAMRGGSSSTTTPIPIFMKAFYAKGGGGGGGSSNATTGLRVGGDIRTPSSSGIVVNVNNPNRPNSSSAFTSGATGTMVLGGATGGVAATRNGQSAYEDVAPYWGGMGGAGGGAASNTSGNGGNGYRGGGGGGGGVCHSIGGIAGGGGNGGNGYVAIFCYK